MPRIFCVTTEFGQWIDFRHLKLDAVDGTFPCHGKLISGICDEKIIFSENSILFMCVCVYVIQMRAVEDIGPACTHENESTNNAQHKIHLTFTENNFTWHEFEISSVIMNG